MTKTVADVMTPAPRTCRRNDSLVAAAKILWEQDCGAVPVVDDGGRVVGMITDRDCLMAAFTRGRKLEDLSVQSAMAHMVFSVRTTDSVDAALRRMTEHAVRRLPAVDEHARIAGIVSFADLCQAKSGVAAAPIAQAAATLTAPRGASTNAQKKAVDVAVSAPVPAAPVSPASAPAPVASAAPAPAPQQAPAAAADASAKKTKGRRI